MYDEEAKKIWEKAREAIQFRRQQKDIVWQELDAFDRGEQWTIKGDMPSWIPRPSTNYVSKVKKFKTGNLIMDDYLGDLKPLVAEDEPKIWMLQRFYEQLWDKLNVKYHILDVIRTSRLLGTGILYVGWDENYIGGTRGHLYQGEILIKAIEPSTFFIDPMAFELEEANYCGTFIRTTEEAIMRDPSIEKDAKKNFKERRNVASTGQLGQYDRGEIYLNRDYSTYQQDVVDLITFYEKIENEDGMGYTIKVTYLADGIVIKEVEEIKPNLFPFVVLRQYEQRQDFWGVSDAQLILPNVKMINKVQSVIGTLATLYQNPQKIVYEGSGIDPRIVSKYGNAFGLVFLSKYPDLNNVIRNVEVADIPRTLLEYVEFLKNDIEDFTGMTDIAQGRRSGSIQTAGGMETMLNRALTGDQDEFTTFEKFIEKVSYAILHNALEYYTDNRVMRMRNENPNSDFEYEYIPFKAEEFEDLEFDFSIDIVQKFRNSDQSKMEVMQMLSEWQLQYSPDVQIVTPEDIVKAFNPPNRDVMLARIRQESETKSQETAAQLFQVVAQGLQTGADPNEIISAVYQMMNPQSAEQLGDVQRRQQGLPTEGAM
jgi:hypothetical protein